MEKRQMANKEKQKKSLWKNQNQGRPPGHRDEDHRTFFWMKESEIKEKQTKSKIEQKKSKKNTEEIKERNDYKK